MPIKEFTWLLTQTRGSGELKISNRPTFYLNPFLTHVRKHKQEKLTDSH